MLVLSRKIDEVIWVGRDVRIIVISVEGNRVRLGIDAPRDVPIDRDEVRQSKYRDDPDLIPGNRP